ncbi:MAG: phage shock protein E [Kangiellaceae bacterium]|jgi:hypothetical protein
MLKNIPELLHEAAANLRCISVRIAASELNENKDLLITCDVDTIQQNCP